VAVVDAQFVLPVLGDGADVWRFFADRANTFLSIEQSIVLRCRNAVTILEMVVTL